MTDKRLQPEAQPENRSLHSMVTLETLGNTPLKIKVSLTFYDVTLS